MHCHQNMMTASAQLCLLAYLTLTLGLTLGLGPNKNMGFTFLLPAGSTECFYQRTAMNDSMEVEYQVIAGSGLDVGFILLSPTGHRLVSDFRRSDGIHMVDPTVDGDYRLCFDNSFSKMSEKMVFFEVVINNQNSKNGGQDDWLETVTSDSMVDYKMEDIRARMDSVHRHLEKSHQVQAMLRAFEARDRYLLEDNLWRVSFWSCVNLSVMLTVAVVQIYTLRRLFVNTKQVRT
ncbi:transmembrane emp24 domain-containing protein 1 [Maylandia zebra]|uniref:Transmembrane p24 trafficking protein 1a n=2 Tax=Haplochromini TaxID=319058 RepID=A0A3P9C8U5_9CICH|nr:transmembrane emp24 domain-containing protein 1 [Maylandia zebra]XP_026020498.1 transmembrane emp24 domain-containing protein 1-like [Astatotilapia calliptera]